MPSKCLASHLHDRSKAWFPYSRHRSPRWKKLYLGDRDCSNRWSCCNAITRFLAILATIWKLGVMLHLVNEIAFSFNNIYRGQRANKRRETQDDSNPASLFYILFHGHYFQKKLMSVICKMRSLKAENIPVRWKYFLHIPV